MRAAYIAIVLLVLSPSAALAIFTLSILARDPAYARERSGGEALHHYTIRVAGFKIPFYPRVWASVLLLLAAILWIVGVVLFVVGFLCLPVGIGASPKRDTSVFFNFADMGAYLRVALVLIPSGVLIALLSFLLPGDD